MRVVCHWSIRFDHLSVLLAVCAALVGSVVIPFEAQAARLRFVSDLINESAPAKGADHRLQFTTVNAIPAGGSLVISFEGEVYVPPTLGVADIDLSVATTATSSDASFVDRPLAAVADALNDGVAVVGGTSTDASITITLNSTQGIGAGETVRIEIGKNATFGAAGATQIINPPGIVPVIVKIEVRDTLGNQIDWAYAAIHTAASVTVGPANYIDVTPPVVYNLKPAYDEVVTGVEDYLEFSFFTDTPATCRYDTVAGTSYASMAYAVISDNASTTPNHRSQVIAVSTSTTYSFYLRCKDFNGNVTDEIPIRFTVGVIPEGSGGGGGGALIGGGSGTSVTGGDYLKQADITISGWAYPGARVTLLQDGKELDTFAAKDDGSFKKLVQGLERGSYTFSMYATDAKGARSSTYASTVFLRAGTVNELAGVVMPPTVRVVSDEVTPGAPIIAYGYAVPYSTLTLSLALRGTGSTVVLVQSTTTASSKGLWQLSLPTRGIARDVYTLLATVTTEEGGKSNVSAPLSVGIGVAPAENLCLRADINSDTRIDLVDFSIMLFLWGTNSAIADIDRSGLVELTDFSILLFCWSG